MKGIIWGLCLLCVFSSLAHAEQCLTFSEGLEQNRVREFLASRKISEKHLKWGSFYSSSYDLNDDDNPEYFYFFEILYFCGTQMGCNLRVYEYKDGTFRDLIRHGLYPGSKFDPRKDDHKKYLCVLEKEDATWKRLKVDGRLEKSYDGTFYRTITK